MQLIPPFALLLLSAGFICSATEYENSSLEAPTHPSNDNENNHDILRRNYEIESRLAQTPIHGLRKMSPDEGEKFFLDYWSFGTESQDLLREDAPTNDTVDEDLPLNLFHPRSYPFQHSFPLEASHGFLGSRDFKCPTGTLACTSIGRSDRCCSIGDACEHVRDTGSGDVGCCPNGETCSDVVGTCPGQETTCSEELGGGCCIPGYECVTGGCALVTVITVTIQSTVVLSTKTYSTAPQSLYSSVSTGSTATTNTATTESLAPPARPTGISTSTKQTTSSVSVCPTGFYACSAVYGGGCCQTGRDCDTTSCPTSRSTTFTSDGVTIVIPVTTGSGTSSGSIGKCATGWFSCADTVGGGCCPSGYTCGSSCTAGASKTTVAKEQATATSGGNKLKISWGLGLGLEPAVRSCGEKAIRIHHRISPTPANLIFYSPLLFIALYVFIFADN
ncbi:GPI anchored protein [Penicillium odoratum]|uniref:GPI anchored protein n=1 Tax=Penicillium odoratum TaxID=1167516 RepID=UPI0025467356|nr:GPI anchored protein [Penicillium odoratum]KAJ5777498.1 GPI anchored protein [Penicillium odoratum]